MISCSPNENTWFAPILIWFVCWRSRRALCESTFGWLNLQLVEKQSLRSSIWSKFEIFDTNVSWCMKFWHVYAGDVGSVYFGPNHPMKPHRLCMTHHLVLSYELHKKMEIYVCQNLYHCLPFSQHLLLSMNNIHPVIMWSHMNGLLQRPHKAYPVELAQFHSADYVEFLHRITPDSQHMFTKELLKCKVHVS